MKKIFLPEAKQNNGIVSCCIDGLPDENGVLNTSEIILHSLVDCYFAGCQRQVINYPPDYIPFPDGFNQLQAVVLQEKSQAKKEECCCSAGWMTEVILQFSQWSFQIV